MHTACCELLGALNPRFKGPSGQKTRSLLGAWQMHAASRIQAGYRRYMVRRIGVILALTITLTLIKARPCRDATRTPVYRTLRPQARVNVKVRMRIDRDIGPIVAALDEVRVLTLILTL